MPRLATHAVAVTALLYAWRSLRLLEGWVRVPSVTEIAEPPLLSIVVPARDEERSIEKCVLSLLAQAGLPCEVIVVNDGSTDGTGSILARMQDTYPELVVVRGETLPDGWVGKPWACAQGARVARGSWLLFTDADSQHEPNASVSMLAFARSRKADAVTVMTGQELGTPAEEMILPAILGMIVFACGELDAINDPAKPNALANGQYLMFSREAYDALGGHDLVRGEIVEDVEFARRIKTDGRFRLVVAEATGLVRVRMYHSLREIWDGFTKNMFLGAHGRIAPIAGGVAFCATLSIAPPLLALDALRRGDRAQAAEALGATALVMAVAYFGAPFVGMPRRLSLYAPIGIAMFGAIALNSTRRGLTGEGFTWRGRTYDSPRND